MTNEPNLPSKFEKGAEVLRAALIKSIDEGLGPIGGARGYAESRLQITGDVDKAIQRIVRETIAASGTTGFTTGFGGLITLPVSIPANITGQAVLNARMVASIAHLRGWDTKDEVVRHAILLTVAGSQPNEVLRQFGIKFSQKMTEAAIKKASIETIRKINQRVGFMLIAKYGTKRSLITLTKAVPIVGGVIGGGVDAAFTKSVSTLAKRGFPVIGPDEPAVVVPHP